MSAKRQGAADLATAYPLQWPAGWPRTPQDELRFGRFSSATSTTYGSGRAMQRKITIAEGCARILDQLERMTGRDVVISTNVPVTRQGLPRSDARAPGDAGAAVYWRDGRLDGWPSRCIAIDRYTTVADNLAAIAATLDAMRAIDRHGGAQILNRAFEGFTALPAPGGTSHWRDVLDPADPEGSYRRLRAQHHPDRGGAADEFHAVQMAYDAYRFERGQGAQA